MWYYKALFLNIFCIHRWLIRLLWLLGVVYHSTKKETRTAYVLVNTVLWHAQQAKIIKIADILSVLYMRMKPYLSSREHEVIFGFSLLCLIENHMRCKGRKSRLFCFSQKNDKITQLGQKRTHRSCQFAGCLRLRLHNSGNTLSSKLLGAEMC